MQTTPAKKLARTRKPADAALPYPKLPETTGARFWSLAYYFRQLAEMEALAKYWSAENRKRKPNDPLVMAMIGAEMQLKDKIRTKNVPRLVEEGLLPFAWAGTTVFRGLA